MDGMTLCIHKSQGRFVHPWLEDAEGPSLQGSSFHERIMVHDRNTRAQIWRFATQDPCEFLHSCFVRLKAWV